MAKQKLHKQPSQHSRAARRAGSPSLNTDKSLKQIKEPSGTSGSATDSFLHRKTASALSKTGSGSSVNAGASSAGGIRKKTKGRLRGTPNARKKAVVLEKAQARTEVLEKKLEKSKNRKRTIDKRRVNLYLDRKASWLSANHLIRLLGKTRTLRSLSFKTQRLGLYLDDFDLIKSFEDVTLLIVLC
jgi:hypothetical protein